MLSNLISNSAVCQGKAMDREKGIKIYMLTKKLLAGRMRQKDTIKFLKAQAAMHVYLDLLAASLQMQWWVPEVMEVLKTGSPNLLTGLAFPRETRHSDFNHYLSGHPALSLHLWTVKDITISVRSESNKVFRCSRNKKQ